MTGAIVLAAGAGSRMGRQKMLLPFAGRTIIEHVVSQVQLGGARDGIIVLGADADDVAAVVAQSGYAIARNPDFTRGMLSSVRTGLTAAPGSWDAALLVLGDQPLIAPEVVRTVLAASDGAPGRIVVPTFDGRRGHPMLLPRGYWHEAMTQYGEVGLRGVLHAHEGDVLAVAIDSEDVLADIDTPDDYARALQRLEDRR